MSTLEIEISCFTVTHPLLEANTHTHNKNSSSSLPVIMTTQAAVPSGNEMAFVPRDLVSIQVGRLYASVYPKVEPMMPIHERAHAFQVIKSAL